MSFELDSASRYYQKIASKLAGIPNTLIYLDDFVVHDLSLSLHTRCFQKDFSVFGDTHFICTILIYYWINTDSVGFHKPLHDLSLLLSSAYDKPNLPLLEETVDSPSCFGRMNF